MTLLIIFLSATNIALGYGLAIYLGHAQTLWAPGKPTADNRPPAAGEKRSKSRHDHTETIDQENDENHDEAAAEGVAETADEVAKDETSPEEKPTAEIAGANEGDANEENANEENVVEEEGSDETPKPSAEQEVLDSVEKIQEEIEEIEEIQEQPEPPTVEEASATETESSIPESADSETADPESQVEQETAASASVSDEELMQGIGAFQEQLKTRQEQSKLHAVQDTSKDQS